MRRRQGQRRFSIVKGAIIKIQSTQRRRHQATRLRTMNAGGDHDPNAAAGRACRSIYVRSDASPSRCRLSFGPARAAPLPCVRNGSARRRRNSSAAARRRFTEVRRAAGVAQTLARGVSVKRHLAKYRAAAIIVQSRARRLGARGRYVAFKRMIGSRCRRRGALARPRAGNVQTTETLYDRGAGGGATARRSQVLRGPRRRRRATGGARAPRDAALRRFRCTVDAVIKMQSVRAAAPAAAPDGGQTAPAAPPGACLAPRSAFRSRRSAARGP